MLNERGTFNNRTLLIDGRFIGIDGVPESYDVLELCSQSSTLRRLLLYMYYNCNTNAEKNFEKDMYYGIWALSQGILNNYSSGHNYLDGDTDISYYIDLWQNICNNGYEYINNFQLDINATFTAGRKNQISLYYENIIEELRDRNINILAHVNGTLYVDILGDLTNNLNATLYNFSTYSDVFNEFNPNARSIYSMGIWLLKSEFYTLLRSIQGETTQYTENYPTVMPKPYIWVVDPLITAPGGLEIILEDELQEINSQTCQESADCTEYDQEELNELFLEYLNFLFV